MFESVLIANRGEIACRVARTAHEMGLRVIAVYSDVDAGAQHVEMADEAYRIGPAEAALSYLNVDAVLEAAKTSGADCIHPGYGFLSENAEFAEACDAAGVVFVGPTPGAIRAMGLKHAAKDLMSKAGVPVVPGYQGDKQDAAFLAERAAETSFPVLIKAVAGGGGKGMRLVEDAAQFADALAACQREAKAAFGDDRVLIERFVTAPRHIEVQVFGDTHGNVVHLFERDCSMQRRHQKVIEEAPAPGMTPDVREAMCTAAVNAAKAVDYVGAGTVEFIADSASGLSADGFFFMEMNTRLQVEHPVTEAITGVDLVEWQLRVAAGEPLPMQQVDLEISGHAVEARIYAEDPNSGFLPQAGRLEMLEWPETGRNLRVDAGVEEEDEISPFYDPMIAKMICHDETRESALAGLANGLADTRILGLRTNLAFNERLLRQDKFVSGDFDTSFIDRNIGRLTDNHLPIPALLLSARAWLDGFVGFELANWGEVWDRLQGWSFAGLTRNDRLHIAINGMEARIEVTWDENPQIKVECGEQSVIADMNDFISADPLIGWIVDGEEFLGHVWWADDSSRVLVLVQGVHCEVIGLDMLNRDVDAGPGGNSLKAPMSGRLIQLLVEQGDQVEAGQKLAVLEAMKMEHNLVAGFSGEVVLIGAREGDQVDEGHVIVGLAGASENGD